MGVALAHILVGNLGTIFILGLAAWLSLGQPEAWPIWLRRVMLAIALFVAALIYTRSTLDAVTVAIPVTRAEGAWKTLAAIAPHSLFEIVAYALPSSLLWAGSKWHTAIKPVATLAATLILLAAVIEVAEPSLWWPLLHFQP
ncbi:MAG: hypothetical protein ACYCRD_04625 [Leptospirillum sp.]